jgi:hypothetical protein
MLVYGLQLFLCDLHGDLNFLLLDLVVNAGIDVRRVVS